MNDKPKSFQHIETLSQREIEVLTWLADGKAHAEIAELLSISEVTVRAHLERASKKLHANNKTHAVAIAMSRGFVKSRQ